MKRTLFITILFLGVLALSSFSLFVFSSASAANENYETITALPNVINADRWQIFPDMVVARGHPGVAVVNDKIHVIGGYNPYGLDYRPVQEVFDPQTDTWKFIEPIEYPRSDFVTLNYSNTIYAIGGYDGETELDFNHVYDPISGTWDTDSKAPLPTAVSGAGGVVLNGKIYVIGGFVGNSETNLVQIYDPASNTWDLGTPMKTARSQFAAVELDGMIYVIGGNYQNTGDFYDVEIFDPGTDTWSDGTPLLERRKYMAGTVRQGKIYIIGGRNEDGDYTNSMFVFDPVTKTWTTGDSMPTARAACRAAVVNDTIYVIGGAGDAPGAGTANEAFGLFPPLTFLPMIVR